MSANGPSLWDVAGLIHEAMNNVPAVETITETLEEEIKEIAASSSSLGATESAPSIVASIAPTVSNMSTALVRYFPFNPLEMCGLDEAPTSSYFGYALGGLSILGGTLGLYGLNRLRADAQKLVSPAVYAVAKDSQPALDLIKANSKNDVVLALLNQEENMRKLLTAEATTKGTLAGIAKMKPMAQLAALQVALTPRVVEQQDDLKEISSDASNAVVGTQAVASSSTPAPAVKLADTILTSDAGKTVLAKIRRHADAVAVLEQMNELSLRSIDKNAPKWAGNSQFMNLNAQQLVTFLVGAAAKCQQVITVEAPKPATTTLKI